MLNAGVLTFQEFAMGEALPLATVQAAIFEFLKNRDDVVVFSAQAVNAWVSEPRMTQDIDLMALNAAELAEEIRQMLSRQFQIAVRVPEVKAGLGYRVYQLQKTGNRHLADIRAIEQLPEFEQIEQVRILAPTGPDRSKSNCVSPTARQAQGWDRLARYRYAAVNFSPSQNRSWPCH
jgi:hypothetical protein